MLPRLLVSVRNAFEARKALAGGCDIIDVKEPRLGSLGFAGADAVCEVAASVSRFELDARCPVSVALGEVADHRQVVSVPDNVDYAKLGLANCVDRSGWVDDWLKVRARLTSGRAEPSWIAVAYVDSNEARSPAPEAVVDAAIGTGCAGVLFDTWTKNGISLLQQMPAGRLVRLRNQARRSGLLFAAAGGLTQEDLHGLIDIEPDVIAVRGGVCRRNQRTAEIATQRVRSFKSAIETTFHAAAGVASSTPTSRS